MASLSRCFAVAQHDKKSKQLLVEGNDDLHVIYALCEKYNIPETFDIVDCKGIEKLIESIPIRLKQSNIDTIGIIIDADTDLSKRWKEISAILVKEGYTAIPETVPTNGLIHREKGKIGIGV